MGSKVGGRHIDWKRENNKEVRCFNPSNKKVIISRYFTIIEKWKQKITEEPQEEDDADENSVSVEKEYELSSSKSEESI